MSLNLRSSTVIRTAAVMPAAVIAVLLLASLLSPTIHTADANRLRTFVLSALGLAFVAAACAAFLIEKLVISNIDRFKSQLEQREHALVDYALDVVCSLDRDCNFLAVSPAALRCWGYLPEKLIGKSLKNILQTADAEKAMESFKATADKTEIETQMVRADGKVLDARWKVTRSTAEGALFCIVSDITERKELERIKRQFMATVTHELRTPLSSLLFTVQLLQRGHYGALNPEGLAQVHETENDVDRMISLINELLDLEKIEAKEFTVKLAETPLAAILEKAIGSVSSIAQKSGVKLSLAPTDIVVLADESRLIQVVVNILSNAIKHAPAASTIAISSDKKQTWAMVRIKDSGPGISKADQQLIFEQFKTLAPAQAGSTGLGLPISKGLIEAHGGQIGVDSEPGHGATFWFTVRCM